MDIAEVVGTLVCTYRVAGLDHCSLRLLRDAKGKLVVATDPVNARPGNWVFTVSGSAGRYAMADATILTDLTIGGIIDDWAPTAATRTQTPANDAAMVAGLGAAPGDQRRDSEQPAKAA